MDEECFIEYDQLQLALYKTNIELIQRVNKLIEKSESKDDQLQEFIKEVRARVLFETLDMDSDAKYLIRGVMESVLYDMEKTER